MLEYLLIHNSYVTVVYMGDIDDIKFQLRCLHLVLCLIKQNKKTIAKIYVVVYVPLLKLSYIHW